VPLKKAVISSVAGRPCSGAAFFEPLLWSGIRLRKRFFQNGNGFLQVWGSALVKDFPFQSHCGHHFYTRFSDQPDITYDLHLQGDPHLTYRLIHDGRDF
jgi:hypothetical protein